MNSIFKNTSLWLMVLVIGVGYLLLKDRKKAKMEAEQGS